MTKKHITQFTFSLFFCICTVISISACSYEPEQEIQFTNSVVELQSVNSETKPLNTDKTPQIVCHHIIDDDDNTQADDKQPEVNENKNNDEFNAVVEDDTNNTEVITDNTDIEIYDTSKKTITDNLTSDTDDISSVPVEDDTNIKTETEETDIIEQQPETETYTPGAFPLYNYNYMSGEYLGRIRIPSVSIDVAIYYSNSQATCDAVDSAMFFYGGTPFDAYNYTIISGDHSYQGFDVIKNCTVGTELYIDSVDGNTYKYICDSIDYNGRHSDYEPYFTASDGHDIEFDSGLWLYTCNSSWVNCTFVHFFHC